MPPASFLYSKKHLVIFSSHPAPASCVFIPAYLMSFLAWQVLLCSYRICSLHMIIMLFALFWISSILKQCLQENKARTAHSFLKRVMDQLRIAYISGQAWLDSDPLLFTMLMCDFPPSLFLCPNHYWWELIKFALVLRYLPLREEKELLAQHGCFDDCHHVICTK